MVLWKCPHWVGPYFSSILFSIFGHFWRWLHSKGGIQNFENHQKMANFLVEISVIPIPIPSLKSTLCLCYGREIKNTVDFTFSRRSLKEIFQNIIIVWNLPLLELILSPSHRIVLIPSLLLIRYFNTLNANTRVFTDVSLDKVAISAKTQSGQSWSPLNLNFMIERIKMHKSRCFF